MILWVEEQRDVLAAVVRERELGNLTIDYRALWRWRGRKGLFSKSQGKERKKYDESVRMGKTLLGNIVPTPFPRGREEEE